MPPPKWSGPNGVELNHRTALAQTAASSADPRGGRPSVRAKSWLT